MKLSPAPYRSHVLLQGLSGKAGGVVDDGGEVGGAPELQLREAPLVGLDDALDPCANVHPYRTSFYVQSASRRAFLTSTKGVGGIEIDRKLVGHLEHSFKGETRRFGSGWVEFFH